MTQQTFDPYASLSLPDMLDQAKLKMVWRPFWKSIKGTPLENDLPVLMVEMANEYLKRHAQAVNASLPSVGEAERLVHTFMEGACYVTGDRGYTDRLSKAKVYRQAVYWKDRLMEHGLKVLKWKCTCDWANGVQNPKCEECKGDNMFLAEVEALGHSTKDSTT